MGRPIGSKNKPRDINETDVKAAKQTGKVVDEVKKQGRRGRPPGSRNKKPVIPVEVSNNDLDQDLGNVITELPSVEEPTAEELAAIEKDMVPALASISFSSNSTDSTSIFDSKELKPFMTSINWLYDNLSDITKERVATSEITHMPNPRKLATTLLAFLGIDPVKLATYFKKNKNG